MSLISAIKSWVKPNYQSISPDELKEWLKKKKKIQLIDVRTPMEVQQGAIKQHRMINLQAPDFKQKISKLDKGKTYVVYCRSGGRSSRACGIMADMGFEELYNLKGGYRAWEQLD
jgi:rhodanese-related sulfurtransferase